MSKKERLYTFDELDSKLTRHIDLTAERLYQKLLMQKEEKSY